jgi:prepilin-type N-terminal cleavage/methylation domain-containing protein
MKHCVQNTRHGFTLVEIMIVVAIIATLAAIAVPGFLRSRKRAQATTIINDARIIDAAMDQYGIENHKKNTDTVTSASLKGYLKPNTRLYALAAAGADLTDIFGNSYNYTTFDRGVQVNGSTTASFADVIDDGSAFWGTYK